MKYTCTYRRWKREKEKKRSGRIATTADANYCGFFNIFIIENFKCVGTNDLSTSPFSDKRFKTPKMLSLYLKYTVTKTDDDQTLITIHS